MIHRLYYALLALLLTAIGSLLFLYYTTNQSLNETKVELITTSATLEETESKLASERETVENLRAALSEVRDALESEEARNEAIEEQVENITGWLRDVDKLQNTDEELLQKYSKVYFLNEHYEPSDLVEIDTEYTVGDDLYFIHGHVYPFLEDLIEEAKDDDIELQIASAYRSFTRQTQLKGRYTQTYGSGANAFSADQGYSEHQLGTTVDFTAPELNGVLQGFENTEAYEWLTKNAHKYGFTLSYPRDNEYYIFEPWHWRFVGEELAEDLHDEGDHFYDWDQRRLDGYLLNIFD